MTEFSQDDAAVASWIGDDIKAGLLGPAQTFFDTVQISIASTEEMERWSFGEVKRPETINYRTLAPEKDGLFCEKIFGPTKDWECRCGKYKRVRYKGVVCEKCGVEVTRAKVRRERMGHIALASPVTHIWYYKGIPSQLGHALGIAPKDLEKVIYFGSYLITDVNTEQRATDQDELFKELLVEKAELSKRKEKELNARLVRLEEELSLAEKENQSTKTVKTKGDKDIESITRRFDTLLERLDETWETFLKLEAKQLIEDEPLYRELQLKYSSYFESGIGAEAIEAVLEKLDLAAEAAELKNIVATGKGQKLLSANKRLKVISAFLTSSSKPTSMILHVIPVIPPDLRPMVQLDGGRFATSDLNDLYRRVINRNNRLKRLLELGAPDIIVNNEKRMLQEAVDSLFDNGRRGRPVTGPNNRALKSLADMLKGKQGRFRQNLLGKRVDYSGRSVIVVGPQLKLHQCGLPKQMALELFKPFVMRKLVETNVAQNIKAAKRMVEREHSAVWDVLEDVIQGQAVLLNRAPTLHRLGIQAFEPLLIEGKAIQVHPLVCTAFNADFDGDQMAVHLPLSIEAQAEARILMLSANNILSPASGKPITAPTQDMILGIYYLTTVLKSKEESSENPPKIFTSSSEARLAADAEAVNLREMVTIRFSESEAKKMGSENTKTRLETTLGRCLFNDTLPADYPFVNKDISKKELSIIVGEIVAKYPTHVAAEVLDALKSLGFYWATRSGVTIGIEDVLTSPEKAGILAEHEKEAKKVDKQYNKGYITAHERNQELIQIWNKATGEVAEAMEKGFPKENPVFMMIDSGARGNMMQMRQIAGMKGLVSNPKGEIIPRPIKANFVEGLSVLEFFISTHGARKGLADTALRTADSGYLTRRLVDVSQDVIIREDDCKTLRSIAYDLTENSERLDTVLYGKLLAESIIVDGEMILKEQEALTEDALALLEKAGVSKIRVRSILTCQAPIGVCASCYGLALATSKKVEMGEAVGIVAAQSIGEPGTQLTMRTFHAGGVAGEDITQGLPKVVELFEARVPKGVSPIVELEGKVSIDSSGKNKKVTITADDGSNISYAVPLRSRLLVEEGSMVKIGDKLTAGAVDPHEVLRILGPREVQKHLVNEVQQVYRSQGVQIHDKHIEIIIRQMLFRVLVLESGDTNLLAGSLVTRVDLERINKATVAEGKKPASARPILMGITKASLATDSWLSAASFQETTRILTQAAVAGKSDHLVGLKENVIIGNLIPAGTGLAQYQNMLPKATSATEEAKSVVSLEEVKIYGAKVYDESVNDYDEDMHFN